jgi:hypothetical protein
MPVGTDERGVTIAFGPESEGPDIALASLCRLDLAVGLELPDGRRDDGVLPEVLGDHLPVRGFDNRVAVHTDELILIHVADIAGVEVS